MLNKFDDYPIHQTAEPIAHPASSDRNVYDRTWFNGYSSDGSYYFGIGMAIYPHRGILDCAFSVVERDGRQHSFYASRRAPTERTEMEVGPFQLEVIEPMRRAKLTLQDNTTGISAELIFSARTAAIQEGRQTLWQGTRRVMDASRFAQFGRWRGVIRHPDGEIQVTESACNGTKDRSWGVRGIGEPDAGGAPVPRSPVFFAWAPLFWDDHVSHAIWFDGPNGEALIREGFVAPLYPSEAAIVGTDDGRVERMATALHRIQYVKGTRLARSAEVDLIDLNGKTRTISLDPILKFQMKGLGYGHAEWGQGMWKGELAIGSEAWNPKEVDPLSPSNVHVQQVVKAADGQRQGIGVFEQVAFGPYYPSGFKEFLDGFR